MYTVDARKIMNKPINELWMRLRGKFKMKFDNGVVIDTDWKQVIYSRYFWELHLKYGIQITERHHVASVIKNNTIRNDSHLKLLANITWDIYDAVRGTNTDTYALFDDLARSTYHLSCVLYNEITTKCEEYISSVDLSDFVQMAAHQEILSEKAKYSKETITSDDINHLYKHSITTFNTNPDFAQNKLKLGVEIGAISESQLMQCVVMRGKVFDIDTHHFKFPIMESFTEGITDLNSSMMESRSAAISLFNTHDDLQNSEYMNRRHQLLTMVLQNLHHGDCGSQNYLDVFILDKKYLSKVAGKYYLMNDGNLGIVTPYDTSLIGQTIKVRSLVAGCQHPDPYGCCSTCVGENSLTIPKGAGLGHSMVVITNEKISQLILSTKHYLASAVAAEMELASDMVGYLKLKSGCYYLDPAIKNKKPILSIEQGYILGLSDITSAADVNKLSFKRVSNIPKIKLILSGDGYSDTIPFLLQQKNSTPSISYEMMEYLKDMSNWVHSDKDTVDIDMSKWNYDNRVFLLPIKSTSMSDYRKDIQTMFESTSKELEVRRNTINPNDFLIEFFELVNDELDISLSVIDVVTYCSMIIDPDTHNYGLPKVNTGCSLGGLRDTIANRSAAAFMAFQGHQAYFGDPTKYLYPSKVSHPFDAIIMPEICNI